MRIQHNIMAMNAYRNYNNNTSALSKNLEKLSSGYKINRAGDDAAGLAISEKMRAQITGLNAAQKNVKDGISLVKTAEGAMQEIHDMLNRMSYLATQSANGTYDNEVDRLNLQKEVKSLKDEINRIADSANFNGIKLLNGDQETTSDLAVATQDASMNIDGKGALIGQKAAISFTLGSAANGPTANALTPSASVNGSQTANKGTKATLTFTTKDNTDATLTNADKTTIGTVVVDSATKAEDLAAETVGGKKLEDFFTLYVGGTETAWDDDTAFGVGTEIKLVANANGNVGDTMNTALNGITNATYTKGKDVGTAADATNAKYEAKLTMANLAGGQKIELGGKTLTITADQTKTNAQDDFFVLTGNAATDATNLQAALEATFTDYTATVTETGDVTLTAKNESVQGNQGALRFYDAAGQLMGNNVVEYNRFVPATQDGGSTYSSVSYTLKTQDLKAGAELTIGNGGQKLTIIGEDGTENEAAGEFKASTLQAKLPEIMEKLGYKGGQVSYDGTTLKITSADKTESADTLKANGGKVTFKAAPAAPAEATAGDGFKITSGTTTVADLKEKYGDLFDVSVTPGAGGAARGDADTISAGDKIQMTAKVAGKLGNNMPSFTGVNATVKDGLDEGMSDGGRATHYDISFDRTKLAGGQSFTFGNVNGTSTTFEFSLDGTTVGSHDTDNGTIGSDGTEVAGKRVLIDLTGTDLSDSNAVANKIKDAVSGELGNAAWKYDVEVNGDSITLKMDAPNVTADTDLGSVRYASAGANPGITGATYKPHVDNQGNKPNTYAQVGWNLDISKLKAGDSLKIGNTTVNFGKQAKVELDNNGDVSSVTVKEGASADDLVKAFETAGYNSGRLKFDTTNNKVTITGTQGTQTADDLAQNAGKVLISTTRTDTLTGGLTLQIGDTADSYNQMTVSIGKMSTSALGIEGVDISTPAGAKDAIDTIKKAINYVSGVRGDLGAIQNRLDHTSNNLSVMAENIQDAESTIRDTDVAAEMMAYTKNNILIQSAQAMLAQANQVPQGVLQLLG